MADIPPRPGFLAPQPSPTGTAAAPPPPPGGQAAPGWFNKAREAKSTREQFAALAPDEAEELLPWHQRLGLWLIKAQSALITAFSVHLLLLVILAMIVLPEKLDDDSLTIFSPTEDEQAEELEIEVPIDLAELIARNEPERAELPPPPTIEPIEMDLDPDSLAPIETDLATLGSVGDSDGGEGAIIQNISMKPGGNAVTKGSFTAWTKPEDPDPGQPYAIFVRVKTPPSMKRYPVRDLQGSFVIGTDDYFQPIPEPIEQRVLLAIEGGYAVYIVNVPGAEKLVKDRITLKSKALREQQVLDLEF